MKAAIYRRHGPPEVVVQIADVEKPVPEDNEVLLKVRAASVNPLDSHLMKGGPYIVRVLLGLGKPKIKRPGVDVAGQVEAVGKNVTQFKPGDAVFGLCKGAFAEYLCAPESAFVIKPDNTTFEQAASVPVAALTALQGLRDKGHIQAGQRVLINGAAGGVGTFAVQIAKSFGAQVTAVCSTRNVDMVRSIGADHVIDYTQENFTKINPGQLVGILGGRGIFSVLTRSVTALVWSRFISQKFVFFVAKLNKQDLTLLGELMATGKVTPIIDRCYSLKQVPEAIRYLSEQHARGKVVITLQ